MQWTHITGEYSCYFSLFLHFPFSAKLPTQLPTWMVVSGAAGSYWINNDDSLLEGTQFGTEQCARSVHAWPPFKGCVSVWSNPDSTDWANGITSQSVMFLWGHPAIQRVKNNHERECIQTMAFCAAMPIYCQTDKYWIRDVSTDTQINR